MEVAVVQHIISITRHISSIHFVAPFFEFFDQTFNLLGNHLEAIPAFHFFGEQFHVVLHKLDAVARLGVEQPVLVVLNAFALKTKYLLLACQSLRVNHSHIVIEIN